MNSQIQIKTGFGMAKWFQLSLLACTVMFGITACQTSNESFPPAALASRSSNTNSLILQPGDNIKISFPGAPNLDAQTSVRLDGKISIPMIGEVTAAGLSPSALEQDLLRIAGPQLVVKQVSVTVLSSGFEIYVEGAVLRPGKLVSERVLSPLEAISDAGLDFTKANLKAVHVIRKGPDGKTYNTRLNLQKVFDGKASSTFVLQPFDIIYVPERFNWL